MVIALGLVDDITPNCLGAELQIRQNDGGKVKCHFPQKGQVEYFRNAIELLFAAREMGQVVALDGRDDRVRIIRFL